MRTWEDKAHEIIARLCFAEWELANRLPNGRLRRKYRQYTVPATAVDLVKCLASHDEETAKSIFLFRYDSNS